MTSTASWTDIYKAVRTRLLTFAPKTGSTVGTLLGNRLYILQGPDTAVFPYGIMRIQSGFQSGQYKGERLAGELEIMLFARPRSQQQALNLVADTCDQAFLRYHDGSSAGLIFSRERMRNDLPAYGAEVDREVVQIQLLYQLVVWPTYLTQYAST